jgi:phage tail-like protein
LRRAEIEALLPAVFQAAVPASRPLAALLDVMEQLHARSEAEFAELDRFFDPARAPEAFVPFLARLVHLDLEVTTGLDRLRTLVARAVWLSHWRGTCVGLIEFLETATGVAGFQIDEPAANGPATRPFHIRVTAPAALRDHEDMLQRIIRQEKPAFVTHELRFA